MASDALHRPTVVVSAMWINTPDLLGLAFGFFNILRLVSYFPQIVAVARDPNGASAISFSCWSIWIGANGSTGLYAWIKLADMPLALISAFNAACCAAVLLLTIYKRVTSSRNSGELVGEEEHA
jgi:hypothetical protein